MASSPLRAGASMEEELEYYKKQYEQLEADLAEFQASSKDLEAQLEADIDAAEKSERKLRQEKEQLQFEVDEWKAKGKNAREEGNRAQNTLQKEVTHLREEKRNLELRLRDVEVVNDDYERQARHTEVSLEDLESKYNSSIERSVMLEEEVKVGEQEREQLRIESQRLRDELGDLRVETDITLEKLRAAEQTIEQLRNQRKPSTLAVESLRGRDDDVASDGSGVTPHSPAASTTPAKSDVASEAMTPPSPPLSDVPMDKKPEPKTPLPQRPRSSLIPDASATPRASGLHGVRATPAPKHVRGASVASTSTTATRDAKMPPPTSKRARQSIKPSNVPEKLPRAESLIQIRSLMGRMQKIEERVQSARSKLPAPSQSTPTGSPRTAGLTVQGSTPRAGSAMSGQLPGSVTLRRSTKRPSQSSRMSLYDNDVEDSTTEETSNLSTSVSGRRDSHVKRLSYGIPRPTSSIGDRPPSAAGVERPPSSSGKRQSISGIASLALPNSRTGTSGRSSAMDFNDIASPRQPRTNTLGKHATIHGTPRSHRPSASVSELRYRANGAQDADTSPTDFRRSFIGPPSASRRTTLDKKGIAFSTPSASKVSTTPKANTQRSPSIRQPPNTHRSATFNSPSNASKSPKNSVTRPAPARHDSTPGRIVNGVTRKFAPESEASVLRKDASGRIIRPRASTSNKTPETSPGSSTFGNGGRNMGPPPRKKTGTTNEPAAARVDASGSAEDDDLGETF